MARPRSFATIDADPAPLLIPAPEWMRSGVCASIGGKDWGSLTDADQVEVCGTCPVIEECREHRIDTTTHAEKAACVAHGGLMPHKLARIVRTTRAGRAE